AAAAIWGAVRSAQSEHPGRFCLIDTDGSEASEKALRAALALGAQEPQIALREGVALAPRLTGAPAEDPSPGPPLDPDKTVVITGGTGGLGAARAGHLAANHGARQLLLISRSGAKAKGAEELIAELEGLGAKARLCACDAADPKALAALLGEIPSAHPLG